jgi:hypothetical protein
MATENATPLPDEENEEAATRDPNDDSLGPVYDTENKEAGEMEAVQHAYDASVPSYELNLDAGIAEDQSDENKEDSNIKQ